jgi:para-aminobenzoate synthetase component I
VSLPFSQSLPWREPIDALVSLGDAHGVLAFVGGGTHPTARWSYLLHEPVQVHQWREGMTGGPFDGLMARLEHTGISPDPQLGPFQGGWAGLLSYELGRAFERLPWPSENGALPLRPATGTWPDVWLGLYDTLAIFDAHQKTCVVVSWGLDENGQPNRTYAHQRVSVLVDLLNQQKPKPIGQPSKGLQPMAQREAAETSIARAVDYIHSGDIFQANISIRFGGRLGEGDRPLDLFERLVGRHPSPFATFLSLGDRAVVSHSPERFLSRTASGQLETRPIKGTSPRHGDPQIDADNATRLQASVKDRAENLMIVDLMRNDLARVCLAGSVKVPRLCALESFSTVHHLVSDVVGQQCEGQSFFDALAASFPPGSITGAPKVRAMEIIAELEGEPRGPWCGSMIRVGFDGAADSSVLIRTAVCERGPKGWSIQARAGAGIVADSVPKSEYEEMLVKARALRVAALNEESP